MLQITDIQAQKKRAQYFSIFINKEYCFSLSELDLATASLHIGQKLSESELEQLQKTSLASKAYFRGIYYLKYGPRTIWQMRQYLQTKGGFEEEEITVAIQRLETERYLNDEAYIESFINSRQNYKPSSKQKLYADLRKKGIDKGLIELKLSEIDQSNQLEAVIRVAKKKITQPKYQDQQKLLEYLIRQGFSYSLVKEALDEINSEVS